MIRMAAIVFVILGLIIHPLVMIVPAHMNASASIDISASIHGDKHDHATQNADTTTKALCHQATVEPFAQHCIDCDVDCDNNGLCASSCVLSGAVAIQKTSINLDLQQNTLITLAFSFPVIGLTSRIFHPPRYS